MATTAQKAKGMFLIGLVAAVFFFGAFWTYWRQKTGTPVQASITSCSGGRRSQVCRGSWTLDGRVHLGEIEGVSRVDLGKRIEVRAWDDRAIKPGLRLPIILLVIGLAFLGLGAKWWQEQG
jgi:hypothetical protein